LVLADAPHRSDCLEETGKQMKSLSLAAELGRAITAWPAPRSSSATPNGVRFLASASLMLSFRAMTWPHHHGRRTVLPGGEDSVRSPLSSRLIRELAGVLPWRRHFLLLLDVMG
jgi:hypothetical protein